jgi:beta-lactamase regulating signal transducer with metallopeptidase domain
MNTFHPVAIVSLQVMVLVALVALLQWILRSRLSARARCWLWGLVVIRLCLPVSFGTRWSLFNLLPGGSATLAAPVPHIATATGTVTESTPIPSLDGPASTPSASPILLPAPTVPVPSAEFPSPIQPTASRTAGLPFHPLVLIWALGAMAVLGRTLWISRRMARWVASGSRSSDPTLLRAIDEARRLVGISRPISAIELPGLDSPALYGCVHPRLLLPVGFVQRLDESQLRHVLLHECAHVRRQDIALNWLLAFLESIYWFHPAVWFAFARLRAERELACDDIALQAAGSDDSQAYGRTILRLLSFWTRPAPSPGLVGILDDAQDLRRRLVHIAEFRPGRRLSLTTLLVVALAGAVTLTDARPPTNQPGLGPASPTNLPPVIPIRYTNSFVPPENRDLSGGANWAKAPRGSNFLGGVHFEIDGLIQLAGLISTQQQLGFREYVSLAIPTNQYGSVHLLAATAWSAPANRRVADVIWRYTDGSLNRSPILHNGHVRNWRRKPFEEPHRVHSRHAKAAAVWSSPDAEKAGAALRMYRVTLANPEPARTVAALQVQSAMEPASLMLLAVSLDPLAPGERPDPTPDLEPEDPRWTAHIGVTVIDAGTSNAIGGARIVTEISTPSIRASRAYRADGSGFADVLVPDSGPRTMTISALVLGYEPERVIVVRTNDSPPPTALTLALNRQVTVGGRVLDPASNPVAGATLDVAVAVAGDASSGGRMGNRTHLAVTGPDGSWSATNLPSVLSGVTIYASHEDFVSVRIEEQTEPPTFKDQLLRKEHVLRLVPGFKVSGTVVGLNGSPVPDAAIRIGGLFAGFKKGKTDTSGRFTIGGLAARKTTISAQAKGYGRAVLALDIKVPTPEVRIEMNPPTPRRGVVIDLAGQPIPNVQVSAHRGLFNQEDPLAEFGDFRTTTDSSGHWHWDEGPPGDFEINFWKPGFVSRTRVPIPAGPDEVVTVLELPRVVEGLVLDEESGRPVTEFTMAPASKGGVWPGDYDAFVSEDGRFTLKLELEEYDQLRVASPTHFSTTVPIPPAVRGAVQMTIRLRKAEELSGIVVNASGRPVSGATVASWSRGEDIQIQDGYLQVDFGRRPATVTAEDGFFREAQNGGTKGIVAASPQGFGYTPIEEFRTSRRVQLIPFGRIQGRWSDPSNPNGKRGFGIRFFTKTQEPMPWIIGLGTSRTSEPPYSYQFMWIPAGTHQFYTIDEATGASNLSLFQEVTVRPGETIELDVALPSSPSAPTPP